MELKDQFMAVKALMDDGQLPFTFILREMVELFENFFKYMEKHAQEDHGESCKSPVKRRSPLQSKSKTSKVKGKEKARIGGKKRSSVGRKRHEEKSKTSS